MVWLVACFVVRPDFRGQGITHLLLQSAVREATDAGAAAVEGWPSGGSDARAADAFHGREELFADVGFTCVSRPTTSRAIMRLSIAAALG